MKFILTYLFIVSIVLADMKVYVSKNSAIDSISLQELKNLYLKKTKLLNGQKVIVYDNLDEYEDFCTQVINKTSGQMHAYWMRQIFLGKSIPPHKVKYSEITTLLNSNPTAISYSELPLDAKAIYEFK